MSKQDISLQYLEFFSRDEIKCGQDISERIWRSSEITVYETDKSLKSLVS